MLYSGIGSKDNLKKYFWTETIIELMCIALMSCPFANGKNQVSSWKDGKPKEKVWWEVIVDPKAQGT